jgi:serine/threonine-protein kinase HipA
VSERASERMLELEVSVSGRRVGVLRGGPGATIRFILDRDWVGEGQQPRLGWAYLVDTSPRGGSTRLPAWFENLLPEVGSPLRRRVCEHHGLHEHDGAALLTVLGRDLPGAVEIRGAVDPDEDEHDAEGDVGFAGRLRFSVAGMQPKLSMIRRDDDRWVFPAKDELGDWYVKLAGPRYEDLPSIEAATMGWARTVGLDVPEHRLVPVEQLLDVDPGFAAGSITAFAIQRFDRIAGRRFHQEDLAQALEIHPYDKYGGPGRLAVSYDSLTRLVADACGDDARGEMIERLAFMVACGNDDAHLKNWSLQWPPGEPRPRLSPCYDLVATVSWPEFGWSGESEPELALPFARSQRWVDLDAARVKLFAERAQAPDGVERFMAALERVGQAWLQCEAEAPERLRSGVREHWSRVPVLRFLGGL